MCTLCPIQTGHSSRVKWELWRQKTIVWWVRVLERTNKGDSRVSEREEHVFNTPVQSNTHPAALHALCLLALVCCESWRQKLYSWWGCNYGSSVWDNVTCLFHIAVAQQAISEKDTFQWRGSEVISLIPCQDHFHSGWAGIGGTSFCWCEYLNQWL